MSDHLTEVRILSRVARCGSFSAAAREFGLTQPAVSRAITRLERTVGVALLTRSTRAVSLTGAGTAYLAKAEHALAALAEAEQAARGSKELRGILRVALTSSVAVRKIIPALPTFTAHHPELRLVLFIADERRGLVKEGIDLSVRLGPLEDSSMVARAIARWRFNLFAAPAYLASRGVPDSPDDLDRLQAIYHLETPTQHWTFRKGHATVHRGVQPRHVVSSQEGCVAAAKVGLGYIYSAAPAVQGEIERKTLVPFLTDWDIGSLEMNIVFPAGRRASGAARAFADFVAELFTAPAGNEGQLVSTPMTISM